MPSHRVRSLPAHIDAVIELADEIRQPLLRILEARHESELTGGVDHVPEAAEVVACCRDRIFGQLQPADDFAKVVAHRSEPRRADAIPPPGGRTTTVTSCLTDLRTCGTDRSKSVPFQ